MQVARIFGVIALVLTLALPVAFAKEVKVKLEDCPAAVQKTIKDHAGDGKIIEIEKETQKNGAVVYEAEVKKNGKVLDIEIAADGTLLGIDEEDDDDDEDEDEDDD